MNQFKIQNDARGLEEAALTKFKIQDSHPQGDGVSTNKMPLIKQPMLMLLLASQVFLINVAVKAQTSDPGAVVVETIESDSDVPVTAPRRKRQETFLEKTLDLYIKGQEYLTTARKYIDIDFNKFRIKWGNISTEIGKAIDKALKDGNKDPYKTGDGVNDAISDGEDPELINTPSEVQGENAEIDVHRSYTRAQSQAILGAEGQERIEEEAEITNTAVTDTLKEADAVQADVITQDILKKMAVQNLQTVIITKALHSEGQRQTQLLATTNMNLGDISEQMDVEAKKKSAESAATSREILRAGAALDAFWKNQ
jgi:hypothetical protein